MGDEGGSVSRRAAQEAELRAFKDKLAGGQVRLGWKKKNGEERRGEDRLVMSRSAPS